MKSTGLPKSAGALVALVGRSISGCHARIRTTIPNGFCCPFMLLLRPFKIGCRSFVDD
jgi:hypothetical protein